MNKKGQAGLCVIRIIVMLFILAGAAGIAFFPFQNRNLKVHFIMDEAEVVIYLSNQAVASGSCREVIFEENMDVVQIEKVRIYGRSETMMLKEFSADEMFRYIEYVESGEAKWIGDRFILTGEKQIHFVLNEEFQKILQQISASFLQERILLMGLYGCFIAIVVFAKNIYRERQSDETGGHHGTMFEMWQFWKDIRDYSQYMVYAARTDLKAEVANSYLNRLWWLLEPFFNMIVYVIVFGNVMGNSVENYATFVFSALLMWNFFNKTINYSVKLVRSSKDIITKVYIPKFILLLSNMILNLFKLLFSMVVLVAMMLVFRVQVGWNLFWTVPAYIVMFLLAFGVGMIFLHFGVYVDDLSYAVGILLNMLMFLSGIFYQTMTTLPEPLNGIVMSLNPLAIVVDTMRSALLDNCAANLPVLGMWFLIAVILCCIGVHIVYKNENSYVKIV